MENKIEKLIFQIERSQKAYELYLEKKYFYQALRIYEANRQIYLILANNGELWNHSIKKLIFEYIFHLEDWLNQFEYIRESNQPKLDDTFVFTRFEDSIAFPQNIIERLKTLKQ